MLLVVGEALVEFMRPDVDVPLDVPAAFVGPFPSGAPAIFASTTARLGVPTELCALVGDDPFGRALLSRLRRDGVGTSRCRAEPDLPTATAFVAYTGTGARSFVFNVRHAAAGGLRAEDLGDLPERAEWLHVSGSAVALGASLAETAILAAERVLAAGGRVSVDPNVRPEATSPQIEQQLGWLVRRASVVFPSEGELAALGLDEETLAAAGAIVCATRGAAGARLHSDGEVVDVAAPAVREVDPTGAGDTFAGAFMAALVAGADPREAAALACRAAATAVTVLGPMEAPVDPALLAPLRARRMQRQG
jgi:sugar/nucleoside kinase (ribokinase family)